MKSTGHSLMLNISGLLAMMIFLSACQPASDSESSAVPPVVRLIQVDPQPVLVERFFPARLEASRATNLSFQVPGKLVNLPVIKGDEIQQGALIAGLDKTDYQLNVSSARVAFEQTQRDLRRLQQLRNQNHVSQAQLDEARTARDRAEVELERANQHLVYTEIFSPYDAVIADRMLESFSQVAAGTPVVRLHDLSRIEVHIDVPEILLPQVQDVNEFHVTATLPSLPEREFELDFKEFSTEPDPRSRTYQVTFDMENPSDLRLLPGMSATVKIALLNDRTVLPLLPLQALVGEGETRHVFIYDETTQRVQRRTVTVGKLTTKGVAVLSGLHEGEKIVAAGAGFLSDGMQVRPEMSLQESR